VLIILGIDFFVKFNFILCLEITELTKTIQKYLLKAQKSSKGPRLKPNPSGIYT